MRRLLASLAAVGLLVGLAAAPVGAASKPATTCTGSLLPGTYGSITVPAGATCDLRAGPVTVLGGVQVSPGASFFLGVESTGPASGTINGGTINGGIIANGAAQVQVYNALIHGAVLVQGGSGPVVPGPACWPPSPSKPLCWYFSDFSDDTITGGVTINRYDGIWLGFIRNHVNGTVMLTNNRQTYDETDVGDNVVHGSLLCSGNVPQENTGFSAGGPSTVTGHDTCHYPPPA
jgi:hypothetical protein